MRSKKAINLLNKLPKKLNQFYRKNSLKGLVVNNKSKVSSKYNPVTDLDKSFEMFIRSIIIKNFPKDGIIGEEYKDKKSSNNFSWSIDPIDGTKAFIAGKSSWSNLISYCYKNFPLIGLANFPKLKKYYINDDKKSYLLNNKKKRRIKSSDKKSIKNIKIIASFHSKKNDTIKNRLITKFGNSLRLSSFDALSYCLLAEGKVEAVIEDNLKPYDILPLIPIVEKSGGIITNWNKKNAKKGGNILAACNKMIYNKINKILTTKN